MLCTQSSVVDADDVRPTGVPTMRTVGVTTAAAACTSIVSSRQFIITRVDKLLETLAWRLVVELVILQA